jgi:hypothetical protein
MKTNEEMGFSTIGRLEVYAGRGFLYLEYDHRASKSLICNAKINNHLIPHMNLYSIVTVNK